MLIRKASIMRAIISGVILLFLTVASYGQTPLETAEDFKVKDPEGNIYELFNILDQNKIVMLDFFTTGCGNCQIAAPHVQQTYEYFGCGEGNVEIIAVNFGASNPDVLEFQDTYGIFTPVCSGLDGGGNEVHQLYQVNIYPTFVIIAPDRTIIHQQVYPQETDHFIELISEAGGEPMECTVGVQKQESETSALKIYPVPTSNFITLEIGKEFSENSEVRIYNSCGKMVYHSEPTNDSRGRMEIDVSGFNTGIYHAVISSENRQLTKGRFFVQ